MMLDNWIIVSTVVRAEEGPAPHVTVILVTGVQHIAVEEQGITCSQQQYSSLLWTIIYFSYIIMQMGSFYILVTLLVNCIPGFSVVHFE